tara:strand:- start:568 stop:756 length:189 start_codon:yes stop_codon:yes gene_type:complete
MVNLNDFYPVPYEQLAGNERFMNMIKDNTNVLLEPTSGIGSMISPIKDEFPNMKIYSNELSE